jgi:hypothetical protein
LATPHQVCVQLLAKLKPAAGIFFLGYNDLCAWMGNLSLHGESILLIPSGAANKGQAEDISQAQTYSFGLPFPYILERINK